MNTNSLFDSGQLSTSCDVAIMRSVCCEQYWFPEMIGAATTSCQKGRRGQARLVTCLSGSSVNVALTIQTLFDKTVSIFGLVSIDPADEKRYFIVREAQKLGLDLRLLPFGDSTFTTCIIRFKEDPLDELMLQAKDTCIDPAGAEASLKTLTEEYAPPIRIATGVTDHDAPLVSCFFTTGAPLFTVLNARPELLAATDACSPLLKGLGLLSCNRKECELLLNRTLTVSNLTSSLLQPLFDRGIRNILVSCGDEGAVFLTPNQRLHEPVGDHGPVLTTIGAGDALLGGFIGAQCSGQSIPHALKIAVLIAGLKVTLPGGASLPSKEMLARTH